MNQLTNTRVVIGIDNGSTGAIGVLGLEKALYVKTPVVKVRDYKKAASYVTRVDHVKLKEFLYSVLSRTTDVSVLLEPPMVNIFTFKATASALRALETTLVVLEQLGLSAVNPGDIASGYQFVLAKDWQAEVFKDVIVPMKARLKAQGDKGASNVFGTRTIPKDTFKRWSREYGEKLYPELSEHFHKVKVVRKGNKQVDVGDADAILIAHYGMQHLLNATGEK